MLNGRELGWGEERQDMSIFPSPPPPPSFVFSQSSSPLESLLIRSSPLHVFLSKMAAVTCERRINQHSRPTKYASLQAMDEQETRSNISLGYKM